MSIFYVFQGETYDEESAGGYVWSPQRNKVGSKNAGYTMMTKVKKGDFILHNSNGNIMAISIAQSDCYKDNQPAELASANTSVTWNDEGYRIDTKYYEFENPVKATNYKGWLKANYDPDSAFTKNGTGKQQYMCRLADHQMSFLLGKVIDNQKNPAILGKLKAIRDEIFQDIESGYDSAEVDAIEDYVDSADSTPITGWPGIVEPQETIVSSTTSRIIPKRNLKRAADALKKANYKCEVNKKDTTFHRKSNGKPYTEPHHLIPLSKYKDFSTSLDVMENIVSLCSNCHNLLHYGCMKEKKPVLTKLYNDRKAALGAIGINLTLEQLLSYYK